MLALSLSKQADKYLVRLSKKHAGQISRRILAMRNDIGAFQTIELRGYAPYCRVKSGEYRIIFKIEDDTLFVTLIGKRNDDEIYKRIERLIG